MPIVREAMESSSFVSKNTWVRVFQLSGEGYTLYRAREFPKMQLSENVPVSDDVRTETNEWMRRFFGVHCMVPENTYFVMDGLRQIHLNPKTFDLVVKLAQQANVKLNLAKVVQPAL